MKALILVATVLLTCVGSHLSFAGDAPGPYVVVSGSDSGVTTSSCRRIMSNNEWVALWKAHSHRQDKTELGISVQRRLDIDFDNCMVIAIFGGSRWNTKGVRFVSSKDAENEFILRLDWLTYQSPEDGDKVTPYGFFILPRRKSPIKIQFDSRTLQERADKEPPEWKDFQTLPAVESKE